MIDRQRTVSYLVIGLAAIAMGCGGSSNGNNPTSPTTASPAHLTAPAADTPSDNEQLDTLRPTLTVKNGTSDQPAGTRTYEFQVSDNTSFASATALTPAQFAIVLNKTAVAENPAGKTSFQVDADLQPTTRYYWRARMVQGTSQSDWSPVMRFKTKLAGYNRAGELYDPLIHGETVGEVFGSTEFIPGKGVRLNTSTSYVRYLLPQTITAGEFSMEVEGLRPNGPGDKTKVFGMQEGTGDYITNHYRVDVQYRGSSGYPPNAVTFRVIYGDDACCKYEPDTATRFASVFLLDPSTTYFWKYTWAPGTEVRTTMREGGIDGTRTLYDVGVAARRGMYAPNPHYAFIGTPTGRSGAESASIPGAIYRNVWLSDRPRPASLGSALR